MNPLLWHRPRLRRRIQKVFPQLLFVLAVYNLYACGALFALAHELRWSFVVTFKESRTPALWWEYQTLRDACPENSLRRSWDDQVQKFRKSRVQATAYALRVVVRCAARPAAPLGRWPRWFFSPATG